MIFKELKVLELASVLAGPGVGMFFAELGADVIKVENATTHGDVTRTWRLRGEAEGNLSAYFCSVNWGKRSIAVDLSTPEGIQIVHALVRRADVVISSYKPGDAAKLGVDYETLAVLNPRIIVGQVTGYGPQNPNVGYDAVIQAETGFMDMNGVADGPPTKMPVALIDVLAGHQLKEGLLLALIKRGQTGKGELVEVSLIQAALASLVNQASNWLVANSVPKRQGSAHPNIAPYGDSFLTKDGKRILLAVGSDRQFVDLCGILDLTAGSDPRFATNQRRVENREALNSLIGAAMILRTANEVLARLNKSKVPSGVIQNVEEAFLLPEAREIVFQENGIKGVYSYVGSNRGVQKLISPPKFGEHTQEILLELGLT